jgi:hypothetical protein
MAPGAASAPAAPAVPVAGGAAVPAAAPASEGGWAPDAPVGRRSETAGARLDVLAARFWPVAADLAAVGVLGAAVAAYFWPAIVHGLVAYENDTRIFYFPLYVHLSQALKAGQLPLWSPQIFGGYPIFADGEGGSLYPLHLLLLLLLPVETAFIWLRPIRFFQAALFTYLFCRTIGVGRFGAVVGALAFALSGFATAQLHHINISTAAVWLPLALAFVELALRHSGRVRYAFAILAGVAFGLQALIIHVQVVLMSAITFAAYCGYRAACGPLGHGRGPQAAVSAWWGRSALRRLRSRPLAGALGRLGVAAGLVAIAGATGGALAAVQLLPLYELSTFSFRGAGVSYAFASQYSLPPVQLISLLVPEFFVVNGLYWGLWSRWEVFAYVGVAPLVLALVGAAYARHRLVPFFVLLGAGALVVALGEYAPFGIHRTLAGLPGFSALRAPGRFIFLFTLSAAVLAALGADALRRDFGSPARPRGPGRVAALSLVLLLLQIAAMAAPLVASLAGTYVETHKDAAAAWLQATFMRMRGFDPRWTTEHLYQFLVGRLDLAQPTMLKQLALLLAATTLITLWERLRTLGRLWQALLVAVIAVDLIAVGQRFHPTATFAAFREPSGVAAFLQQQPGLYRVFTQKGTRDEPNRLLEYDVAEANGYSSLEPDRHVQFAAAAEYAPNRLLDLMNARYYALSNRFQGQPSFELTSFNPRRALVSSTGRNPAGSAAFALPDVPAHALRVVSSLRWAATVPQGTEVARLTATDSAGQRHVFHLLAGVHTAEWAWERPDLRGKIPHQLPRVAHTWQQQDGRAPAFPGHFYYAEFPLGARILVRRVEVQFLHPTAQVEIHGLATIDDESKDVEQLELGKHAKFERVFADSQVTLYENRDHLPRAFLVPSAVIERSSPEILVRMAHGDWSPERYVIVEERLDVSLLAPVAPADRPPPPIRFSRPQGTEVTSGPGTVRLVRVDPDYLRLEVDAAQNAMLFLADLAYPGWKAYVDGVETRIYRANYIYRAVLVPTGQHTVAFVYRPRSFRLGLLITLASTVVVAGALAALALAWPRRTGVATMTLPGTGPPAAAADTADGATHERKGGRGYGRQEPEEHGQEERAEEGSGHQSQEEVALPSQR